MGRRVGWLFWKWLPVLIWIGIIAVESTDMMSSRHTEGFLYTFLRAVVGPLSQSQLELLNAVLRKTGHFVGYGVLAMLTYRALYATFGSAVSRLWCWSVALTALVASLDEWHQSLLCSRTGAFRDVVLDIFGGAACLLLLLAANRLWRNRPAETA